MNRIENLIHFITNQNLHNKSKQINEYIQIDFQNEKNCKYIFLITSSLSKFILWKDDHLCLFFKLIKFINKENNIISKNQLNEIKIIFNFNIHSF
jgi:hypothetical protein